MFDIKQLETPPVDYLLPTLGEVESARRWREWDFSGPGPSLESALPDEASKMSDADIAALISQPAHDLVYETEVAGKAGYEKRYMQPEWPGGESGITIGVGFDLGYHTAAEFERAFKGVINPFAYDRLLPYIGFTTSSSSPDRAMRIARARQIVRDLADIKIPWDQADAAYRNFTVPKFGRLTVRALPNSRNLHPHSFGALYSLIYNRGAGMGSSPSRREMRNIRDHLQNHHPDFVPAEFRAMKRIWEGEFAGLVKRRELEARLFERGLSEKAVAVAQAPVAPAGLESASSSWASPDIDVDLNRWIDDAGGQPSLDGPFEASNEWDGVHWPKDDDQSPEYRHISTRTLKGHAFEFSAKDLELLITANRFDPIRTNDRIVFGLRGAILVKSLQDAVGVPMQVDQDRLILLETRPDHRTFRCTIGCYNLKTGKLSGFIANTVPNARAVLLNKQGKTGANMLPSGCYRFMVGNHAPNKRNLPGCLVENGAPRCVIRSNNDLTFDLKDLFDPTPPGDNIHPSFHDRSAQFSSFGCQTIRGDVDGDRIIGEYADFRHAMGFATPPDRKDNGKLFDYILLTGLEAVIAVDLANKGLASDSAVVDAELGRLRQGSKGDLVRRLQAAVGHEPTGDFSPKLKRKLVDIQRAALGWGDGVYGPEMDQKLKLTVFTQLQPQPAPAPVVATAPAVPGPAGVPNGAGAAGTQSGVASRMGLENAVIAARGTTAPTDRLYYEIGARSRMARADLEGFNTAPIPDPSMHEAFLGMEYSDVVRHGQKVFSRIERSVQELICGDAAHDTSDREQIRQALNSASTQGEEAVIVTLTWILTSYLFLPPPINRAGAELIVKRVLKPVVTDSGQAMLDTGCKAWAQNLRSTVASGGTS